MRAMIITFFLAFLLANGVFGSFLNVRNKCGFPVYCSAARSDPPHGTFTPIAKVPAGATWRSPLEAKSNNIGAVMKCSPDAKVPDTNQYQLELTVHGVSGQSWLDLSIVNGQPFTPYQRAAYFPSMGNKCTRLQCAPGDHSCEWCPNVGQTTCTPPRYIVCDTTSADAWMYLCGYGKRDAVEEIDQDSS
ncbi:hypothetical protein LA080_006620 [Diaporthe eres]|nr:hypothetical protein LA080_006620 [Diaporthe eres]